MEEEEIGGWEKVEDEGGKGLGRRMKKGYGWGIK